MFTPYDTEPIRANKQMGGFFVQAFILNHEDCPCYGALIRHKETQETILYATDTSFIRYNFKACKINHFMVEVNYQDEYVDFDAPNFQHKLKGHQSLNTCKKFLSENNTPSIKSVIALHLGIGSTNEIEIIDSIHNVVGDNVFVDIASAGKVFEI